MGTSREDYAALLPVVQEIALQLTAKTKSEWTLRKNEEPEPYFHLLSGNAHLLISTEYGKPERLVIDGNKPRGKDNQYVHAYEQGADGRGWNEVKYSSITVATKRGAETIAKEIISRFLPDYLNAVRLTLATIATDEAYETARFANLQACASTLNEVLTAPNGYNTRVEDRTAFSSKIGEVIRVEVKASATDVDLKIENLTVEQAKHLLEVVQSMHALTEREQNQNFNTHVGR
jgi:hypothetical protein